MKKPFVILNKAQQKEFDLVAPGWREILGVDVYDAPTFDKEPK